MIPFGIDTCPDDDPEHAKYHRRASILFGVARASAWISAVSTVIFVFTFPVALWLADWDVVRRSCVALFFAVGGALLVRFAGEVQNHLYKAEMVRLAHEATSVSAAAEKLLREDGTTEGYA